MRRPLQGWFVGESTKVLCNLLVSSRSRVRSDSSLGKRCLVRQKRRGVGFPRSPARPVELRYYRDASIKTDTIDVQVLHDALDVVSRFGERNTFHPIDRIHVGIARIA